MIPIASKDCVKTKAGQLREQLRSGWVFAAGCFDALSGKIAENVGFRALHLTGFGFEATQIGAPDMGLSTLTEISAQVARICGAVEVPMIVDVDTGFGGVENVMRTIRELERCGAGGIHIEDQEFPKRCPMVAGRRILGANEAAGRIEAAVAARRDSNFVIVARSDADEISYDELVTRCNLYLASGADVAMPLMMRPNGLVFTALSSDEKMQVFERLITDIDGPVLGMEVPAGYSVSDMQELGFAVIILPVLSLQAAASAMSRALREAVHDGQAVEYFKRNPVEMGSEAIMDLLGIEEYLENQRTFGPERVPAPR